MESTSGISKELRDILKEPETEKFLLKLQSHLIKSTNENQRRNNKKYSLTFYRNLPLLDRKLDELSMQEKKLLKVKVNSLITYLDDINKISFPSPFIIGVFTAVISLVLGVMIKDPAAFPKWTIAMVIGCFVLFIPGISWFTLDQSGKAAELKEVLSTIKEILQ
ncbi:hypothetical protein [Virgibacillus necropolis]|uniref:Uncharacterized protein n=1 Tax=Virgibacillus necropolis TaxID=163877 RepID=A0A221MG75_9BACI|nr:hypothetical protein [Virgibacillus necropolis]ASN06645.1 hypothetical protein CFK40_17265 [Virgibacillus necropolis]